MKVDRPAIGDWPAAEPAVLARRTLHRFEAAELAVVGPAVLGAHSHDYASLSVLYLGGYAIHGGREPTVISAPMAAYFPSGVERTVAFRAGTNQFLWVRLPDELVDEIGVAGVEARGFVPFLGGRSQWLGSRLAIEMRRTDPASSLLVHGLLLELLGTLMRSLADLAGDQPAWLAVAMEIFHRSEGTLRIHEIAEQCGLHPTHFTRAFKKHVGCTPQDYLRQQRVSRARLKLLSSDSPLVEIADECGFADQAHLTREFKRIVGSTPARFRREIAAR